MKERQQRPLQLFETILSVAACFWLTRLAFNATVFQNRKGRTITKDNYQDLAVDSEREFAKHYFEAHPDAILYHEPFLVRLTDEEMRAAGLDKSGHLPDFATSLNPNDAAIIEATWSSLSMDKLEQLYVMQAAGLGERYTQVLRDDLRALQNSDDLTNTLHDITKGLL